MHGQCASALVTDHHELYRCGLSVMLKNDFGFSEVVEASTMDYALQELGAHPEISFASFDFGLPGLESAHNIQSVREVFPHLRVMVVTGSNRREDVLMALRAGVHGYVLKTWSTAEISAAVRTILNGEIFVPRFLADLPADPLHRGTKVLENWKEDFARLTPRQLDVLRLIRSGYSNKEIARLLQLSESTVKVHTNALYRALGVHSRSGAAAAVAS